jgi:hypothetical protein
MVAGVGAVIAATSRWRVPMSEQQAGAVQSERRLAPDQEERSEALALIWRSSSEYAT